MKRFWDKIDKTSECWLWIAGIHSGKYGAFKFNGRTQSAHRVSYQLETGEIPKGLFVLHKCDNKLCVRPGHLFLGTQADNMKDMTIKNRGRVGSKNGRSKLTNKNIKEIRTFYATGAFQKTLAKKYNVTQSTISKIVREASWVNLKIDPAV